MRRTAFAVTAVLGCAAFAFVLADEDVTVSRDQVIERLRAHLVLSQDMQKCPKRLQDLVQSRLLDELPALAESVLPDTLTGVTRADVERVLNRPLVIEHPNKECNRLLLKKHLLETLLLVGLGAQTSAPSEESREAVRDNISRMVAGARSLAKKHVAGLVSDEVIEAALAEAERLLVDAMNDGTTLALKQPIDDARIDDWLQQADALLSKNISAANEHLDRMSRYLVPGEVDALKQKAAEQLVRALGPQVIQKLTELTSDAQLGSIDSATIAPGYAETCAALDAIKARLAGGRPGARR